MINLDTKEVLSTIKMVVEKSSVMGAIDINWDNMHKEMALMK